MSTKFTFLFNLTGQGLVERTVGRLLFVFVSFLITSHLQRIAFVSLLLFEVNTHQQFDLRRQLQVWYSSLSQTHTDREKHTHTHSLLDFRLYESVSENRVVREIPFRRDQLWKDGDWLRVSRQHYTVNTRANAIHTFSQKGALRLRDFHQLSSNSLSKFLPIPTGHLSLPLYLPSSTSLTK